MFFIKTTFAIIVSYLVTYLLFLSQFLSFNQPRAPFMGYRWLLFGFALLAFISVFELIDYKLNREVNSRAWKRWMLFILTAICVLTTLAVNNMLINARSAEIAKQVNDSNEYKISMRKIAANTVLNEPTFSLVEGEDNLQLLVSFPVVFKPEAKDTKIKLLDSSIMDNYFWASFDKLTEKNTPVKSSVVGNCKMGNQFLEFRDQRGEKAEKMNLSESNPTFYIRIFFDGRGCTSENLKNMLISRNLYIYSYKTALPNTDKELINQYEIKELIEL
jgi:hypothetical protein